MLSGGAGAKIPNDYEDLWGVEGLLKVLLGEADNIRIEEPGVFDAEFYTEEDGKRLYWQAKIHEERGNWTLSSINYVLASLGKRIAEGNCVRFVSTTDAKELRELARDCRSALDWTEFQRRFLLPVQSRSAHFAQVMRCWGLQDEELTFNRRQFPEVEDRHRLRATGLRTDLERTRKELGPGDLQHRADVWFHQGHRWSGNRYSAELGTAIIRNHR